jgi:hypothetical protein
VTLQDSPGQAAVPLLLAAVVVARVIMAESVAAPQWRRRTSASQAQYATNRQVSAGDQRDDSRNQPSVPDKPSFEPLRRRLSALGHGRQERAWDDHQRESDRSEEDDGESLPRFLEGAP